MEVNRHLNYYKLLLNIAGFVLPVLSSCASCSFTITCEGHQPPDSRSSWDEAVGLAHAGLVRWQAALAGGEPLAGAGATSQCGGCPDGLLRSTPWSGCGRASSIYTKRMRVRETASAKNCRESVCSNFGGAVVEFEGSS